MGLPYWNRLQLLYGARVESHRLLRSVMAQSGSGLALAAWLVLGTSCGASSPPAPETAESAEPEAAREPDEDSEAPGEAEATAEESSAATCDDGSCFACGNGFCPSGWYCDEGAVGGAACSWLPECASKSGCKCLAKALGSGCSCTEEGGAPHVRCD